MSLKKSDDRVEWMCPGASVISLNPYHLKVILPGAPKATNALLGASYWRKHQNSLLWKKMVGVAISPIVRPEKPLGAALISFKRHAWRMLDFDGLTASAKPVVDGLVEIGVLQNDTWKITGPWNVDQVFRPKAMGQFIELEIKERTLLEGT